MEPIVGGPSSAIDLLAVIESEAARILDAYRTDPNGRVPWSDRWTVRSVARHVAGSHHAVALILADRPTADFERAAALPRVEADQPGFVEWFEANTERLLDQCRRVPPDAACWSPHPLIDGTGAYWTRRIAYDTLVHRWDAQAGAGGGKAEMDPVVATDAVDELLRIGLRVTRSMAQAPAGPAVRLECADTSQAWNLDPAAVGALRVEHRPIEVAATLRGDAEPLLLWLWGRIDLPAASIEVDGDPSVVTRWRELFATS